MKKETVQATTGSAHRLFGQMPTSAALQAVLYATQAPRIGGTDRVPAVPSQPHRHHEQPRLTGTAGAVLVARSVTPAAVRADARCRSGMAAIGHGWPEMAQKWERFRPRPRSGKWGTCGSRGTSRECSPGGRHGGKAAPWSGQPPGTRTGKCGTSRGPRASCKEVKAAKRE